MAGVQQLGRVHLSCLDFFDIHGCYAAKKIAWVARRGDCTEMLVKTPRRILPDPHAVGSAYARRPFHYSIDTRVMRDIRQRIEAGQRDGVQLQRWRRFALKTGCARGTLSKTRQPEAFGTTPADNRDVALAIEFPDRRLALTIFCRLELMARNLDGAPFGKGESAQRHCQRGESP